MNKKVFLIHGINGIPLIFEWIKEKLEQKGYKVYMPSFPTRDDCRFNAWKSIMDEYKQFIDEESIVICHSIGNAFIIKYLADEGLKVDLYIGLAGFVDTFWHEDKEFLNKAVIDFKVSESEIKEFVNNTNRRYSIYSNDDHIVPYDILQDCSKKIKSNPILIKNIGHMGKKSGLKEIPIVLDIVYDDKYNYC